LYLKLTPNTHFISALTHCGECVCFTVHWWLSRKRRKDS
jgi:hypothetical protein